MASSDYPIGYKKPPTHTKFKPGASGNPKGRPKGVKNLASDLEEELGEKILVTEGGTQQEITKQRAMLKSLFAKALKGETRASDVLIKLILGVEYAQAEKPQGDGLSKDDYAILDAYREHVLTDPSTIKGEHHE